MARWSRSVQAPRRLRGVRSLKYFANRTLPMAGKTSMANTRLRMRRRKRRLTYLQMRTNNALGALAAADVIAFDFGTNLDREAYFVWAKGTWARQNGTPGEGPIECGFAHSDYTSAEIEECLEASAAWSTGDMVAQEQRKRKVRSCGEFSGTEATEVLNDGQPIFTKLGWAVPEGETLATWARTNELLTTGSNLAFNGIIAVRWM